MSDIDQGHAPTQAPPTGRSKRFYAGVLGSMAGLIGYMLAPGVPWIAVLVLGLVLAYSCPVFRASLSRRGKTG